MTIEQFKRAIRIRSLIKDKQRDIKMINQYINNPDINKVRILDISFTLDIADVIARINSRKSKLQDDINDLEQEFNLI